MENEAGLPACAGTPNHVKHLARLHVRVEPFHHSFEEMKRGKPAHSSSVC